MELDLEQYVIPAPTACTAAIYAANVTEDPRSKFHSHISSQKYANGTISGSHGSVEKVVILSFVSIHDVVIYTSSLWHSCNMIPFCDVVRL